MIESANVDINSLVKEIKNTIPKKVMSKRHKKSVPFLRCMMKHGRPYWYWVWYVYENGKRKQKQKYAGTRKPREDK